jgi:hypothetical protein
MSWIRRRVKILGVSNNTSVCIEHVGQMAESTRQYKGTVLPEEVRERRRGRAARMVTPGYELMQLLALG